MAGVFLFVSKRDKEIPSQYGVLKINNEVTIKNNIVIHFKKNGNYADLPFVEVVKTLGIAVDWVDDDTAT